MLQDLPDVRFILYGDGVEREGLIEQIKDQNLTSVQIRAVAQLEISQYLAFADVVLILLIDDADYAITIPSKTYGYLATGRPIIATQVGTLQN
ncbi:MAG UNVERIFIED_CONTAM: glycosyltransferase [Anaerolineae bacterium]